MPKLILRNRMGERIFDLDKPIITFGRSAECDIQIENDVASRCHAQIETTDVGFKLVDLESRNGTRVNGKLVNQHLLSADDVIEIGDHRIIFAQAISLPPQSEKVGDGPPVVREHARIRRTGSRRQRSDPTVTLVFVGVGGVLALFLVGFLWKFSTRGIRAHEEARRVYDEAEAMVHRREYEAAVERLRMIPTEAGNMYKLAQDRISELVQAIANQQSLEQYREARAALAEIRKFMADNPDALEESENRLKRFRAVHPDPRIQGAVDELLSKIAARRTESRRGEFDEVADESAFLASTYGYSNAVHVLLRFKESNPLSPHIAEVDAKIQEILAQAKVVWEEVHADAQKWLKQNRPDIARSRYSEIIENFGTDFGLDVYVEKARAERQQLE